MKKDENLNRLFGRKYDVEKQEFVKEEGDEDLPRKLSMDQFAKYFADDNKKDKPKK